MALNFLLKNFKIERSRAWEKNGCQMFHEEPPRRQAPGELCPSDSFCFGASFGQEGGTPVCPLPWGLRKSPPLGTTSITRQLVKKKKKHLSVCRIYK